MGTHVRGPPVFFCVFFCLSISLSDFFADHFLLGSKLTQKNTHTNRGSHMTLTRPYLAKDCVFVGFFPPSHPFPPICFFCFAVQQDPFLPAAVFLLFSLGFLLRRLLKASLRRRGCGKGVGRWGRNVRLGDVVRCDGANVKVRGSLRNARGSVEACWAC